MTWKFTYVLVFFASSLFVQRCHSDDNVFDYIFGDDDDVFSFPKPSTEEPGKEAAAAATETAKEPEKEVAKEPAGKSANEWEKEMAKEPSGKFVNESEKEASKKSVKEPPKEENAAAPAQDVQPTPLADFLRLGLGVQERVKEPSIKLGTEDGADDGPLEEFLKGAKLLGDRKKGKKKRRRFRPLRPSSKYILRQVDKLGNKGAPQALMAFSYVINALSQSVKGLKFVVDGSTHVSKKTVETVAGANSSTTGAVQRMLDGTAKATINRVDSWADSLDLLRRSMSGSVKKNLDKNKGHSVTITTSSDAPVKTLAAFADKWGTGKGFNGNGEKGGGGKPSSMLPAMPPALPEVTNVDFSNFWK